MSDELRWGLCMTVGGDEKGRLVAVISDGSPQLGHDPVTVLTVEIVKNPDAAQKMCLEDRVLRKAYREMTK